MFPPDEVLIAAYTATRIFSADRIAVNAEAWAAFLANVPAEWQDADRETSGMRLIYLRKTGRLPRLFRLSQTH
jgi:hypothetical protein